MSTDLRCPDCKHPMSRDGIQPGETALACPGCGRTNPLPETRRSPTIPAFVTRGALVAIPVALVLMALPLLLLPGRPSPATPTEPGPGPIAAVTPPKGTEREKPQPTPVKPPPTEVVAPPAPVEVVPEPNPTPPGPDTPEPPKPPEGKPDPTPVVPEPPRPPKEDPGRNAEVLKYSAIAAVFEANGGNVPTAPTLMTLLTREGATPPQLPVSFSAVAMDSGLANPRVILAPGLKAGGARGVWSPTTAEGTGRASAISRAAVNVPDLAGRLFFAINMAVGKDNRTHARSAEFISWNSQRKRFDFGIIDNLDGAGSPALRVVDGVKCISCHKTHGPILGASPWSNTTHNSLIKKAAESLLPSGSRGPFDGVDVILGDALEVDARVRLGVERARNREAFRIFTRYPGASKMLVRMLAGLVDEDPLTKTDREMQGLIDTAYKETTFSQRWLDYQRTTVSSILRDFSPAGPPPTKPDKPWGDNTEQVTKHDKLRALGNFVLPSAVQPSSPRAFLKFVGAVQGRPSAIVNTTRLAETIGITEGDRTFLIRVLTEAAARSKASVTSLATAVFESPSFTDVVKDGFIPDRDEFKDRFLAGLKGVLDKQYAIKSEGAGVDGVLVGLKDVLAEMRMNQNRSGYARTPEFTPGVEPPEPVLAPTTACLRCHDIRPSGKGLGTDPLPPLAFDPFDKKAREAWLRTAAPAEKERVLGRMLRRMGEEKDMPPEDAPEFEQFRMKEAAAFEAVRSFLEAEFKKVKRD